MTFHTKIQYGIHTQYFNDILYTKIILTCNKLNSLLLQYNIFSIVYDPLLDHIHMWNTVFRRIKQGICQNKSRNISVPGCVKIYPNQECKFNSKFKGSNNYRNK